MTHPLSAEDIFKKLSAPFPSTEIQWKAGSLSECGCWTIPIPFLTARSIQKRLDEVLGPMNWRNSFTEVVTANRISAIRCALGVRINGEWNTKEDGAHVDPAGRVEFLIKGAYSDAEKRAAVQWGLGRYLYSLEMPYVACTSLGKGPTGYVQLDETPLLPPHCLPEEEREAGTAAWNAWKEQIRLRDEDLARQSAEFQEKQRARAEQRSAEAMHKVQQIAQNAVTTHLPATDEFSLREPLHARSSVPQVPDGAPPQSVESLIGHAATMRTTAATEKKPVADSTADVEAAEATFTEKSVIAQDDLPDTGAEAVLPAVINAADCVGDELAGGGIRSAIVNVVAPNEPEKEGASPKVKRDAVSEAERALQSEAKRTRTKPPANVEAPSLLNQPETAAPAAPSSETGDAAIAALAAVVTAEVTATAKAGRAKSRVVSSLVKPDSLLADCQYELQPEDDWKTFREILTKIRTPDSALSILERFIQGPRTKKLLTDGAREFLQSDIERLRSS